MKNSQSIRLLLKKLMRIDFGLIINFYLIISLSLIFVYSATLHKNNTFFIKEIYWIILGSAVFIAVSLIDYKIFAKYSKVLYGLNIFLLTIVLIFGKVVKGSKRWILLGPFSFQPSELAKIILILTFSEFLVHKYQRGIRGWIGFFRAGIHILLPFVLILREPDLGTSLVLMFLFYAMTFLHGVDLLPFISIIMTKISMIPVLFFLLKDYQKTRILVFLKTLFSPNSLVSDKVAYKEGWNVLQSIIAVGSGGIVGKGLFQGTQDKLKFLPESHTDFIFSVLAEETGIIGSAFLLFLYFWLIYRIITIGNKCSEPFGQLVSYGIASVIFFHTFVNIGMVIGMLPVTGLPLLFMSYGGSSYVLTFGMLGIVESIKIYDS